MKAAVKEIPETLIYEMANGVPFFYKGYREYLSGKIQLDELMGSSKIQSLLATELIALLRSFLSDEYLIFGNELGLQFSAKSWRAADIAVIKEEKVPEINDKYLDVAPELVIEIDTKADLSEVRNPLGYYQEKTEELIRFGVERVIWIFTDTRKVMVARKSEKIWEIMDWTEDVELIGDLKVNIAQILAKRKMK
jgi:Uma2 family endonuclease